MSEKVVGLRGDYVPVPGEVHDGCVALLERVLGQAREGQVHCVALVWDHSGDGVRYGLTGTGMGFDMVGGLEMVKRAVQDGMG